MKKGKLGVSLSFLAVLAFVLAIFQQTILCGLLLALVLVYEKDEWLSHQVIQAFLLVLCTSFVRGVADAAYSALIQGLSFVWYGVFESLAVLFGVLEWAILIVAVVFAIIGIVNVSQGREANIPLLRLFADKAYGIVRRPPPPPPPYSYAPTYQQPVMQNQPPPHSAQQYPGGIPESPVMPVPPPAPVPPVPVMEVAPPMMPDPVLPEEPRTEQTPPGDAAAAAIERQDG